MKTKRFFKKSALLFALLFAILELLTHGSRLLVDEFYRFDGFLDYSWFKLLPNKPKIMVMGSSTALLAVSPRAMMEEGGYKPGEVVNVAYHARHPVQSYSIWRNLEPEVRRNVTTVFYGIDPWVWEQRYYQFDDFSMSHWTVPQRLAIVTGIQFPGDDKLKLKVLGYGFLQNAIGHSLKNALVYKAGSVTKAVPEDYGGNALDGHPTNFGTKVVVGDACNPSRLFGVSDYYLDYLARLKAEVLAEGKEFVLFLPPKLMELVAAYREQCATLDKSIRQRLNAKLGPTKVVGSFAFFGKEKDALYMNDTVHVNRQGQKLFSKFLARQAGRLEELKAEPIRSFSDY